MGFPIRSLTYGTGSTSPLTFRRLGLQTFDGLHQQGKVLGPEGILRQDETAVNADDAARQRQLPQCDNDPPPAEAPREADGPDFAAADPSPHPAGAAEDEEPLRPRLHGPDPAPQPPPHFGAEPEGQGRSEDREGQTRDEHPRAGEEEQQKDRGRERHSVCRDHSAPMGLHPHNLHPIRLSHVRACYTGSEPGE
jgi:hypothetical protein